MQSKHRSSLPLVAVSAALLLTTALGAAPKSPARTSAKPAATASADVVKRGEYLVSIMGCNDCHTPFKMTDHGPEPDMTRFLSGHPQAIGALKSAKTEPQWMWAGNATNTAFSGPWGVSYASNLTPDKTGMSIWTEEMFIKTLRTGKRFGGGRPILPPMPWPAYRNATDADLKAIYAYLKTIKPIANRVPAYEPPKPQTAAK